jgi:hypothetical protein
MNEAVDDVVAEVAAGRWMSLPELSEIPGMDHGAALELMMRHSWEREKDIYGQTRVFVPLEWLAQRDEATVSGAALEADVSTAVNKVSKAVVVLNQNLGTMQLAMIKLGTMFAAEQAARIAAETERDQARAQVLEVWRLVRLVNPAV